MKIMTGKNSLKRRCNDESSTPIANALYYVLCLLIIIKLFITNYKDIII